MTYKPDSAVTWIVIHYSATAIEENVSMADIDRGHRRRGFKEAGYHYLIRKDGTVETGRDLGEPGRFEVGAHSKGENSASIGICYEGGVRAANRNLGFDSRTHSQKVAMEALILSLLERFPNAIVEGHRDMPGAATQCPGFNAREWWSGVVARRANEVSYAAAPSPVPARRPIPDEVMTLIEEASDTGSKTTILNTIMQQLSGFGITGTAVLAFMRDIDPMIVGGVLIAGAIVYGVSTYTKASRAKKGQCAIQARLAVEREMQL